MKAKQLFLADLKQMTKSEIKEHLIRSWEATKKQLKDLKIIIAYESVGSWGCDSSAWYLFWHKKRKNFTNFMARIVHVMDLRISLSLKRHLLNI